MKIIKTTSFQIAINSTGDEYADKLAILMPGRLDTKDYINFTSHAKVLADLGFFVVALDPPSTWESPGEIENYTTSMYVQCINELIEYFGNRSTLLLGHSRGGATAILASSNPAVDRIVIVNSAYGNPSQPNPEKIVNGKLQESRDLPPGDIHTEEKMTFEMHLNYFEDGKKHDPLGSLLALRKPKLIIHAAHDEFVNLVKVKDIYKKLKEPKTFVELDCSHDYRLDKESIERVNMSLKDFLRQ